MMWLLKNCICMDPFLRKASLRWIVLRLTLPQGRQYILRLTPLQGRRGKGLANAKLQTVRWQGGLT